MPLNPSGCTRASWRTPTRSSSSRGSRRRPRHPSRAAGAWVALGVAVPVRRRERRQHRRWGTHGGASSGGGVSGGGNTSNVDPWNQHVLRAKICRASCRWSWRVRCWCWARACNAQRCCGDTEWSRRGPVVHPQEATLQERDRIRRRAIDDSAGDGKIRNPLDPSSAFVASSPSAPATSASSALPPLPPPRRRRRGILGRGAGERA